MRISLFIFPTMAALIFGCERTARTTPTTALTSTSRTVSWDSPTIKEIEAESIRLLPPPLDQDKIPQVHEVKDPARQQEVLEQWARVMRRPSEELMSFRNTLRVRLTSNELEALTDSFVTLPYPPPGEISCPRVFQCTLAIFEDDRDRRMLARLLSVYCPKELYYHQDIEFHLCGTPDLEDPVLILGDAFAQSTRAHTKHAIADALRRGFLAHGIEDVNDDVIVKRVCDWYRQHRKELEFNWQYEHNAWDSYALNPEQTRETYSKNPLYRLVTKN